jgi:serine/threonine protein kinase
MTPHRCEAVSAATAPHSEAEASGTRRCASFLRPGARFGEYVVERRLGRGGMAEVWKASPIRSGPPVAIKRLLPPLAERRTTVELFKSEGRIGMMARHRNLVRCLAQEEWAGEPYLVLELVDGPNAAEVLRAVTSSGERLPLAAGIHIVLELLEGLAHLHELRSGEGNGLHIVHRDVSPANVLLDRDGSVKLGDFGIAEPGPLCASEHRALQGKRGYMAPEQIAGDALDGRSDVFAAAIVALELLTGRAPFTGDGEISSLLANYQGAPMGLGRVPSPLRCALERALERDRHARPGSAREFANELHAAARNLRVHPDPGVVQRLLARFALAQPLAGGAVLRRCGPARYPVGDPVQTRWARRAPVVSPSAKQPRPARPSRLSWTAEITRATLPRLIFELAQSRETGLLAARREDAHLSIYLDHGLPAAVEGSAPEQLLGARLVERGLVSERQVAEALALAARMRMRLGEALIETHAVRAATVVRALVAQLRDRFTALGSWRTGDISFFPRVGPPLRALSLHVAPESLAMSALRSGYDWSDLVRLCRPLAGRKWELGDPRALDRLELTSCERDALTAERPYERLESALARDGPGAGDTEFLRALAASVLVGAVASKPHDGETQRFASV